jgi:hypothetical protein
VNATSEPALVIGLCGDDDLDGGFSAGSILGFTIRNNDGTTGMASEDLEVTTTGNVNATFTDTHGSDAYTSFTMVFNEGAGIISPGQGAFTLTGQAPTRIQGTVITVPTAKVIDKCREAIRSIFLAPRLGWAI